MMKPMLTRKYRDRMLTWHLMVSNGRHGKNPFQVLPNAYNIL